MTAGVWDAAPCNQATRDRSLSLPQLLQDHGLPLDGPVSRAISARQTFLGACHKTAGTVTLRRQNLSVTTLCYIRQLS